VPQQPPCSNSSPLERQEQERPSSDRTVEDAGAQIYFIEALFTSPFQPKIFHFPPITSNLSTHA
jgi:hypothetical protein